mmetsp:Transcript_58786/g.119683  ORF Transcript_58786/g.119683 Transcript_58786/m.119683 type:complete len:96 (+) Transcript_58786:56-343(+)
MPLSEPMKAAIVLAIVMAIVMVIVALFIALVLANAIGALTSAVTAKPVAGYAGVGGFAGGLFEDILRVFLPAANMLKNHLPLLAGATAFALCLAS